MQFFYVKWSAEMSLRTLGTIGFAGPVIWAVIVIALHFIQSDLDVVRNYISEYALHDQGWLMNTAFISVGVGTLALALGLYRSVGSGKKEKAGAFNTDPVEVEEATTVGNLHLLGSVFVFFPLVIAPFFLRGVFSRSTRWQSMSRVALYFGFVLLVALIAMFATTETGPVGVTQRTFVVPMVTWLATLGWYMRSLDEAQVEQVEELAT
jgi:hypothetical membrane protein